MDNAKVLFQFLSIFFLIRGVKQEPGEISVFHIQYNMKRVIPQFVEYITPELMQNEYHEVFNIILEHLTDDFLTLVISRIFCCQL